jgi:hypothetical protein
MDSNLSKPDNPNPKKCLNEVGTFQRYFSSRGLKGVKMEYRKAVLRCVAFFGIVFLSIYASQDVDLTGTWKGKMHIPNFGPYEMTMVLEKTDAGYEGTVSDTMGYIAEDTPIQELQVEGNHLSCWFEMTDDSICYMNLTEEDGIMTGEAERAGGVVSCVFVRK